MKFQIIVNVEVERTEGKFVSRADILEQLIEAIEGANPGDLTVGEYDSQYEVAEWDSEEYVAPKPRSERVRESMQKAAPKPKPRLTKVEQRRATATMTRYEKWKAAQGR